jgi:hypothetical protein
MSQVLPTRRRRYQFSLRTMLRRLSNMDRYELLDGVLIRHLGWFKTDRVSLADIKSWQVEYEMVFDFVILDRDGESSVVWRDVDNDLLGILRGQVQHVETKPR